MERHFMWHRPINVIVLCILNNRLLMQDETVFRPTSLEYLKRKYHNLSSLCCLHAECISLRCNFQMVHNRYQHNRLHARNVVAYCKCLLSILFGREKTVAKAFNDNDTFQTLIKTSCNIMSRPGCGRSTLLANAINPDQTKRIIAYAFGSLLHHALTTEAPAVSSVNIMVQANCIYTFC